MSQNRPAGFSSLRMGDTAEVIREKVQDGLTGETKEMQYTQCKIVGNGSFGVVFQTKLSPSGEDAAIKRVLQDKRFKNRELQIMRIVRHPNIVELKAFYYSNGDRKDEVYLNLVLEFVPETVYRASRYFNKLRTTMPALEVKLYIYQLFRSLAYIHSQGICHRDIKPQNLLLDPATGILKLCDFGSAKILVEHEPNVSYICSRYYRAPELIFGATNYTTKIDVWSTGCVMAELMLGQPLFPGESGIDQLVEIIKVLGTPTRDQIRTMNPNYMEHKFPQIKPHPFSKVFRKADNNAIDLISKLLEYTPTQRLSAIEAMVHPFFNELRDPNTKLQDSRHTNGGSRDLPNLFDFTHHGPRSFGLEENVVISDVRVRHRMAHGMTYVAQTRLRGHLPTSLSKNDGRQAYDQVKPVGAGKLNVIRCLTAERPCNNCHKQHIQTLPSLDLSFPSSLAARRRGFCERRLPYMAFNIMDEPVPMELDENIHAPLQITHQKADAKIACASEDTVNHDLFSKQLENLSLVPEATEPMLVDSVKVKPITSPLPLPCPSMRQDLASSELQC
ncbi:hypothetical protein FH972_023646 [Carpinus fangiana]|uniref:non-specific serine/threonine protein kinase n=1 Tax=Carpinus fangiana TaxID=176857 RepID=A0A5N6KW22_9ROSI|nr:hypothetical protein FH972_023646 [Carpinus fangiana]